MARRGRRTKTKTRYRSVTTRSYSRRTSGKSMLKGGLIAGAIAGAGGGLLRKFVNLGGFTQPVADIAVGMYMKNETLETIGGRSIGAMLVSGVTGGTTSGSSGGLVG